MLNGVDITSATSAPIYVSNAEKTVITLADGTENFVTDGASYLFDAGIGRAQRRDFQQGRPDHQRQRAAHRQRQL